MQQKSHPRKAKCLKALAVAGISLALLLGYMAVEPLWIRTHVVNVRSPDVPKSFVGYRIAFLSDVHYGRYLRDGRLRRVVRIVNRNSPDVVLMSGDYISNSARYVNPCFQILSGITAKDGIYCVLGNHDHWVDANLVKRKISEQGFVSLDNNSSWIVRGSDRIVLAGVGDWWEDAHMTDAALQGVSSDDYCVLLAHNPDYFAETKSNRVDLGLAGHTHGGQITFFGLFAPILPVVHKQYRFGLYHLGREQVYVTSGIGAITPPLRFFCRPEVVVFELSN